MFRTDSEKRLARRLRDGDPDAMRHFYGLYAGRLSAVCSRYIGCHDDVKDVMQDSMMSLIRHIGDFDYRGPGSLLAWATRIVVNQCLRFLKDQAKADVIPLDRDVGETVADEEAAADDIPPDVLQRFVMELPTGYRTVFNLYVMENRSHREIATLLGIREDSSASQLNRAKRLLARKITEYKNSKLKRT